MCIGLPSTFPRGTSAVRGDLPVFSGAQELPTGGADFSRRLRPRGNSGVQTMEPTHPEVTATTIDVEELLAHDAWLRGMVRDLVEPDLVEDVVQETFLAAWLKGRVHNLPGFLRRVGRNLAFRQRRSAGRRRARERVRARDEALPATAEMLERLEAHRQLTAAVADLEEPYRTTILLRYFEGLSPKAIAARQGVPASTVRTRVERGLQQLRGRLEGTDLRALAALFLWPDLQAASATTAAASKLAATLFAGAALMSAHGKSSVLLGLLVLLAGTGLWYWNPLGGETTHPEEGVVSQPTTVARQQPAEANERTPLPASTPPAQTTGPVLRGRVLDTRGVPLAQVPVLVDRKDSSVTEYDELLRAKRQQDPVLLARAQTDREGRFELPAARLTPDVEVDARLGTGYVPLWLSVPERRHWSTKEVLVVAAREMSLAGQVVDDKDAPVAGAVVAANVPGLVAFPFSLEDAQALPLGRTGTDANGRFALAGLPDIAELELWVLATGFRRAVVGRADDPSRIVLEPNRGGDRYRIHGTVVDRGLRVVKGARVQVGSKETRTDARGHFDLAFQTLNEKTHLVVARKGHATTCWDQHLDTLRHGTEKTLLVTLTLGDTPRAMAGRVVDEDQKPVAGLVVVVKDVLYLDFYQTAEDLALGRKSKLDYAAGNPMKIDARTDSNGRFEVGGLGPKKYRLHVFDPETLVAIHTEAVAAGTQDLVVVFPRTAIFKELRGVVRSSAGHPLDDVEVKCALRTFQSDTIQAWAPGNITRTGADGTFVLKNVPRTGVHLKVSGSTVMDYDMAIADVHGQEVVLVPPLRCHFRIVDGREDAEAIRLLDGAGQVVPIFKKTGQMSMSGQKWSLRRGSTTTLATSERACTLVYLDGEGKELSRQPIRLEPGRVNELR